MTNHVTMTQFILEMAFLTLPLTQKSSLNYVTVKRVPQEDFQTDCHFLIGSSVIAKGHTMYSLKSN